MGGYNFEKIRDDANCIVIAERLGIPMQKRGSRVCIPCPEHRERVGHEDRKIGNCSLNERGYYCFACGAKGGAVRMAQYALNVSKREAIARVVDELGCPEDYKTGAIETDPFPLTGEQLDLLGLRPAYKPRVSHEGMTTAYYYSIQSLYRDDLESFWILVGNKAKEKRENLEGVLDNDFARVLLWELYRDKMDYDELMFGVSTELKKMVAKCKSLEAMAGYRLSRLSKKAS